MSASPRTLTDTELLVGGQALIEGVMMRSPGAYGIAVRKPDGSIAVARGKVVPWAKRYPIFKLPFLRGIAVLFQSLAIGIRALNFSAAAAIDEKPAGEETAPAQGDSSWSIAVAMTFALVLGAAVFLFLPLWLTQLGERHLFGTLSGLSFNLLDGALRALFFLGYIVLISRFPDIHRVFMYHGAEHKVVFTWEKQQPLTVDSARAQSRLHPRCGTSFLLFVLLISILIFALIPKTSPFAIKLAGRLVLVPLIAGASYEVLRLTAKRRAAPLFAALVYPGLMLQRITTQEPTDDMLQVAIVALEEALREDGLLPEKTTDESEDATPSFAAAGA
jgi:uncharacterized protein YqhQ